MVDQKFLATIIITYCLLIKTETTVANSDDKFPPPIANTGCPSQCGDVKIPYPFGIGPDCSFDKWFEIDCKNLSKRLLHQQKPFLNQLHGQVEVLNISVENGTLRVFNGISFFNCQRKRTQLTLNLSGTPFSFSDSRNRFTAAAAYGNHYTSIDSIPNNATHRNSGCFISKCDKYYSTNNELNNDEYCKGRNCCCQVIIPSFLSSYKVNFQSYRDDQGPRNESANSHKKKQLYCRYAFVVDQSWFKSLSGGLDQVRKMDHVPVLLNWDLLDDNNNNRHQKIKKIIKESSLAPSSNCYRTEANAFIDGIRLRCRCKDGYTGNPYLSAGCQDIDECHENSTLCPQGTTCVNTRGNFRCDDRTTHKIRLILIGVSSGLGTLVLLFGALGLNKVIKRRKDIKRKEKFFKRNGGLLLQQEISSGEASPNRQTKLFNSKELEKATNQYNANRILGQGGQGTVYKGMLEDGRIVAVKKSKQVGQSKVTEFINEVVILSQINHRNIVKLLGCCLETEVPLLVYELIPHGTLYHYIHEQNEEFQLTWEKRLRIATEVAGALSYLHFATSFPIYHRDIKSTNILLDDKYRAKVADFGTSRSISEDQTHLTTQVSGTFGYMDPEYFRSSQFTEKSDVYSFGVVIVELLSGQKPIILTGSMKGRSLATYFIECVEENHLFDIVDGRIINEGSNEAIIKVASLAYRCLNLLGKNRPTMKEVSAELEGIQKSLEVISCDDQMQILES